MKFIKINRDTWYRKEYFEHFLNQQTTFSITNEINITNLMKNLKKKDYKFYPAFIFMVTKIVNSHREFRINFNSEGTLGYWTEMCPCYTIFDKKTHLFSGIWSPCTPDFTEFHTSYEKDVEKFNGTGSLFPKTPIPENSIPISMVPWSSFTSLNLNIRNGGDSLNPIITGGKYSEVNDEIFMPVSLQIHHSVCDGYHASVFMSDLQRMADDSADWIS
ncbi:type A chloramphenicol O-acetyltransferase [Bacillus haikouensis]|uniref:type A chloramphenicol O-acetyltransferase n=1 Tax=Bacillus haikouensis TaxID=1510468 RepID=UPI0015544AC1|nr:type A chloramphenicol O-acetyltransferase [Bacillus haikouensis]NQD68388.1 type A chloramphenicol O-acetyltransferase [Bacillus haikouensis]